MLAHDDFVGCKRDQRAARHGHSGAQDRDLSLVFTNRLRDLQRCEYKAARRVQDEIERYVLVRHLDGAQNILGIVYVDVTCDRKAQQPHGFLAGARAGSPAIFVRPRVARSCAPAWPRAIRYRNIGWIAENIKKSQKRSPIDMEASYGKWHVIPAPRVSKPSTPSSG